MNLIEHAKKELELLGYDINQAEENPSKWVFEDVIELLDVFAKQGHSGSSAPYVLDLFKRLASWDCLSPLTGLDDEWCECSDGVMQNKRLSSVFKEGKAAYYIDGYVFWDWSERDLEPGEDGYPGVERFKSCFSSRMSRKIVEFPYSKEDPEYIKVDSFEVNKETNEKEKGTGWWELVYPESVIKESDTLDALIKGENGKQ